MGVWDADAADAISSPAGVGGGELSEERVVAGFVAFLESGFHSDL